MEYGSSQRPFEEKYILDNLCRKMWWLLLGVLAPEVPMLIACGQWASVKRSVNDMRKLDYNEAEWSLEHAWYADSGGFELQPLENEPFPITVRQVRYLIKHVFIHLPSITEEEKWDKSNADEVAKFLALFQTAWLVVQTVGRAI
jgi:hypothetical protein